MGKSNKFDYTNRPNSGAKLGHIISSALQKESEKVQKDVERHVQKARKQSTDSVVTELDPMRHVIDLKAPGKDLGDEGVCALAEGLEAALTMSGKLASLALVDLNLSANGLTTTSLARLASIIKLARCDLQTVNLSGNKIKVESDEEAAEWETFLNAFGWCLKLRRLDLSGNSELGSRALEIVTRVHVYEQRINPLQPGGEQLVQSLSSLTNDDEADTPTQRAYENGIPSSMTNAQLLKRRCGLRSLPYLTLHEVGMDDAGALWLSYVLQDHHYPNQLMDELNATNAESMIKTYQQDTKSRGVDWTNNKSLGKEGAQLLDKTEALRQQAMLDDDITMTSSGVLEGDDSPIEAPNPRMRKSIDRRASRATPADRRVSIRSIRTDDGGEHEATELESARRRIQRHIIGHDGARSVELWSAALKVFRASRVLLYIAPTGPRIYYPDTSVLAHNIQANSPSLADSPVVGSPPQLSLDTTNFTKSSSATNGSHVSKIVLSPPGRTGSPELAVTEVTNTPTTPLKIQRPTTRKGGFSEGTDLGSVTDKLNVMIVRDDSPARFVRDQQKRIHETKQASRHYRDENHPCHLPAHIIEYIISLAYGKRMLGVLSKTQRRATIERGQRRETLTAEREWLKKDESAQVWMLLDSVDCLSYGD
jgi:hypothetical protein